MTWDKTRVRKQEKMLSCILKNQMVIMQAIQSHLLTYEHTAQYGKYYMDKLGERITDTAGILQTPRKKKRENCPNRTWTGACRGMCALCDAVSDEECLLEK